MNIEQKFLAKVDWSTVVNLNSCWNFMTAPLVKGYRRFYYFKHPIRAHRFSYWLYHHKMQSDLIRVESPLVCHSCDNPACVNPMHLYLGSIQMNNLDRDNKNRFAHSENHGMAKLTQAKVDLIRSGLSRSRAELAQQLNVSASTVSLVKANKIWKVRV